jgi:hypothetical protein
MVATYAEHTRSRNMKDTFRENNKNIVYSIVLGPTYTEYPRDRNVEATFRGNHETLGYPGCNGYYIY